VLVPVPVVVELELPCATAVPLAVWRVDTDTIAILSAPDPTVWLQLRLLSPASRVFLLETESKAIGKVAGFLTFVWSTVIDLRHSKSAQALETITSEIKNAVRIRKVRWILRP
jgi:hypothetical protein